MLLTYFRLHYYVIFVNYALKSIVFFKKIASFDLFDMPILYHNTIVYMALKARSFIIMHHMLGSFISF